MEVRTKYDAHRHGFVAVIEKVEPVPVSWRLLLGDAASNFRAALDHLAWALVSRGTRSPDVLTPSEEAAVYFPIFDDRLKYNASLCRKLPGVGRADLAKVRRCQPYHVGQRTRPNHVLTWLTSINSGDKHRAIQPLWIEAAVIHLEVLESRDCLVHGLRTNRWRKRPLEPGTQLAYIAARRTGPNPQLQMKVNITAEASVGGRVTIQEWSTRTPAFLVRILTEFSDPPQQIVESIADITRLAATAKALEAAEAERL